MEKKTPESAGRRIPSEQSILFDLKYIINAISYLNDIFKDGSKQEYILASLFDLRRKLNEVISKSGI